VGQVASEGQDNAFVDQLSHCLTSLAAPLCRAQAVKDFEDQSSGLTSDGKAGWVEGAV